MTAPFMVSKNTEAGVPYILYCSSRPTTTSLYKVPDWSPEQVTSVSEPRLSKVEISVPEQLATKADIGEQTISKAAETLMNAVDTESFEELNAKRNSLIEKLASTRMAMADSETKKIARWQRGRDRLKQKMDLVAERDALLKTAKGVEQLEQAKSAEQKYLASLEKLRNKQQLLQSQLTEKKQKRERLIECESELQQLEKDMESLNREIQEKDMQSLSREASVQDPVNS